MMRDEEGGKMEEQALQIRRELGELARRAKERREVKVRQPLDYVVPEERVCNEVKQMKVELVSRPYADVSRKVMAAGAVGTPVALIVTWALTSLLGVPVPPEVATAVGSLLATGIGYLVKERQRKEAVQ